MSNLFLWTEATSTKNQAGVAELDEYLEDTQNMGHTDKHIKQSNATIIGLK